MSRSPAAFVALDRDGTLIEECHYLSHPDQVRLIPGAARAARTLCEAGFRLVVVTNQSGLARGYFDAARLEAIHERLERLLATEGAKVDAIYVCPHHPRDGCGCRKPRTGLLERAIRDLDLDPARGFVVGDKRCDVELARALDLSGVLVLTGWGRAERARAEGLAHAVVSDLAEAASLIASGRLERARGTVADRAPRRPSARAASAGTTPCGRRRR